MTTLRLYLRPGWPESEAALPWALLDSHGALTHSGDSTPEHWPRAERIELIIPSGRTLFTQVRLPTTTRQPAQNVIGFALEEGLVNDPVANLYCLGARPNNEGDYPVAVTEAAPVQRAVALLKSRGRLVDRILPEEVLLPLPPQQGWSVAQQGMTWLIRRAEDAMCRVPVLPEQAEKALLHHLWQLEPPASLMACGQGTATELQRLSLIVDCAMTVTGEHDWRTARGTSSFDFAQGDLAARRRWRQWRPSLQRTGLIILAFFIIYLTLFAVEAAWWSWRKVMLSAAIVTRVDELTATKNMSSSEAIRTVTRLVDQQRRAHGLLAYDDALVLMAALTALLGENPRIESVSYDNGQLTVRLPSVSADLFAQWEARLKAYSIRLQSRSLAQGEKELVLSRES